MLPYVGPPTSLPYAPEAMIPHSLKRKMRMAMADRTTAAPIYGSAAQAPAAAQPVLSAAQQAQQQQELHRRQEASKRQSRKPTDRNLPDGLEDVCIGDGAERYKRLQEIERKLDTAMMQKRLDISEEYAHPRLREGTMRVWISNTAEGQPWQVLEEGGETFGADGNFDFGENSQARYRVKVEGHLLPNPDEDDTDDEGDGIEQDGQEKKEDKKPKLHLPTDKTKFSHFFKSITVDFDRPASLQPDGFTSIEWKKPAAANPQAPGQQQGSDNNEADFDKLEFERKADEEMNVTINLVRDEQPERFKLSPALANLLDTKEDTRAGVVAGIWEYIRAFGLQEDEENRRIVCDEGLKAVFDTNSLYFPYIPDQILPHLTPLPPIKLAYTIRMDKAYLSPDPSTDTIASKPTVYDIRVAIPHPIVAKMRAIHSSPSHLANLKAILAMDDDIALLIQKITHLNAKRKFYDAFAQDPASFVKRWVSSQQRDLEVVLAEGGRGFGDEGYVGDEFRKGGKDGVWGGDLAKESVGLWLARQSKAA